MKSINSKIKIALLLIGGAMIGVVGYLLGFMMEFGDLAENVFWFLGLMVMGMALTGMSIGQNHKTMSMFGLLMAFLSGLIFFFMRFFAVYASAETDGLSAFLMFVIVIFVIMTYELLMHALPDDGMSAEPTETE